MKLIHTPTDKMPPASEFPYRLLCKCGNTLLACETPLPKWLKEKLEGTPCSKCVKPSEYLKRFEK